MTCFHKGSFFAANLQHYLPGRASLKTNKSLMPNSSLFLSMQGINYLTKWDLFSKASLPEERPFNLLLPCWDHGWKCCRYSAIFPWNIVLRWSPTWYQEGYIDWWIFQFFSRIVGDVSKFIDFILIYWDFLVKLSLLWPVNMGQHHSNPVKCPKMNWEELNPGLHAKFPSS